MKSWNYKTSEFIETPEKLIKFMQELEALYKKYDLSIAHEDQGGGFIIEKYSDFNMEWMKDCTVNFL
jgi:hypothetical protein